MRSNTFVLCALFVSAAAAPAAADVQLTIQNGQVSLVATNATPREILAEWTKVGGTRIVNAERIPGGPMTISLTSVSEDQALKVILRTAAGYVTAPRPIAVLTGSQYDRILVMPTTSPARGVAPGAPPFAGPVNAPFQPPFQQLPPQFRAPVADDPNVDEPGVPTPNPRGPIFNTFTPPQIQITPQQPVPNAVRPAIPGPVGVAVPGMVVPGPTTAQPGQPTQRQP